MPKQIKVGSTWLNLSPSETPNALDLVQMKVDLGTCASCGDSYKGQFGVCHACPESKRFGSCCLKGLYRWVVPSTGEEETGQLCPAHRNTLIIPHERAKMLASELEKTRRVEETQTHAYVKALKETSKD